MKTKLKIAALALLLATMNLQFSTAFAQGSLTPPGAPAPTMKTLAQIEPRTPISSLPFTISVPGSYYLTTNLTATVSNAIVIATNGVTLNLSGFTIASTVASAANGGTAILLGSGLRNITIQNGFIQGGVTNNGIGVYSGSGFGYGIYYSGNAAVNVHVIGISVSGCLYYGIYLGLGDAMLVETCVVRTTGGYGILASTIKSSLATDCGGPAVYADQASDCRGQTTGSSTGLTANYTAQNCYGASANGTGLNSDSALNCYGISNGSPAGISADCAFNCVGYSSSGDGIIAYTSAQNCYGSSNTSYGLSAYVAQNCYGLSNSGIGLIAIETAQNCLGYCFGSVQGLTAPYANSCYGYSSSGIGLTANYANFCFGTSVSVSGAKYNMP